MTPPCTCRRDAPIGNGPDEPQVCALHRPPITCPRCLRGVHEDQTLDGSTCLDCAAEAGLERCDDCGRAAHRGVMAHERQLTERGRLMLWTRCPACEREHQRATR